MRGLTGALVTGVVILTIVMAMPSAGAFLSNAGAATSAPLVAAEPPCQKAEGTPTPVCRVYVLFMENQPYYKVNNTPYEGRNLGPHYAVAAQFYSVIHYSFPNYLAATAGIETNYLHVMNRPNVVDLIKNHTPALTWDAYMQGMGRLCNPNSSSNYRAAHNPFVFYSDIWDNQSYCRAHDLTYVQWDSMLQQGNLPDYAFFAPNVTNSCWKSGLYYCDQALKYWLNPLLTQRPYLNSHVAWIITYDESLKNDTQSSNGTAVGGGHIYTAVVSPYACHDYYSQVHYNSYSILTTTEWLLGLGRIGHGAMDNWSVNPPMKDMFCFNSTTTSGSGAGAVSGGVLGDVGVAGSATPAAIAIPAVREGRETDDRV